MGPTLSSRRCPEAAVADAPPLSRLQRILVGSDGTITHLLEAYAGEPVEAVKLYQGFTTPTRGDRLLSLRGDERLLRRRVLLRTARGGRTLLYARATVVLDRVPPAFGDDLMETDEPLGILLVEHRIESRREILFVGREPAGACATHFGIEPHDEVITRTYRILVRRRPAIAITEKFPVGSFCDLGPDQSGLVSVAAGG